MIDRKIPYFEKFGTLRIDLSQVLYYRVYYASNNYRPHQISFFLITKEKEVVSWPEDDKKEWEEARDVLDKFFQIEKVSL